MFAARSLWYLCAITCVRASMKAMKPAYSFSLATNPSPTRARSYSLNINPNPTRNPKVFRDPLGSGRVADLYSPPSISPQSWDPWARLWTPNCSSAAHCSGCVLCVCLFTTHCCVCALGWLNAEHEFRVWVTILGHTSHPFLSFLINILKISLMIRFYFPSLHLQSEVVKDILI